MFSYNYFLDILTVFFSIFTIFILHKIYYNATKGMYRGNERLEGKTVIVTGSCAGIGAETSRDLARRGARVIMVCKDPERGEKVRQDIIDRSGNRNVILKLVDFSSLENVRKCANEILAEESRVDVLVNNAGAIGLNLHERTVDGLEILMQTNYFGPFLFTNILLGKIQESSTARIINVSSHIHAFADLDVNNANQTHVRNQFIMYANSKLAVNFFTLFLADKLKDTGVIVNCLHPGVINSGLTKTFGSTVFFLWNVAARLLFKSSWEGAQTSIFLSVSPDVEDVTGKYFSDCRETKSSKDALDYSRAEQLWKVSVNVVNLRKSEEHFETC